LTGYYRKFIKNYGWISRPLTNLLIKNAFQWSEDASQAFRALKSAICSAPVLAMPDFSKPFILETDACDTGIGVILAAVQKWRHYLQGGPFVIKTDHISLKYLLDQRLTHTLQHKGPCKLLGLDYIVQKESGEQSCRCFI
jgi:RNase H-like domain found in reverse transcriptase